MKFLRNLFVLMVLGLVFGCSSKSETVLPENPDPPNPDAERQLGAPPPAKPK